MAFLMTQARGAATTGTQRALDVQATSLHDRIPIVMGSKLDVELYEKFCKDYRAGAGELREAKFAERGPALSPSRNIGAG